MATEAALITYDEFSSNLETVLRRVAREYETVIVETREGARVVLRALPRTRGRRNIDAVASDTAFHSAFGGWKGLVDADILKRQLSNSRGSDRPSVELWTTLSLPTG